MKASPANKKTARNQAIMLIHRTNQNASYAAIAKAFGISKQRVHKIITREQKHG